MTTQKILTTEQILDIIREKNNLKELSFGCIVRDKHSKVQYVATDKPHQMRGFPQWDAVPLQGFKNAQNTLSYEIIGHPVHLEHLLKTIGHWYWIAGDGCIWKTAGVGSNTYRIDGARFDLTKSVEQNLNENKALRKFMSEVLSN